MAGLGYKAFASGEVLTAANLQGYAVDQSMMRFDSASARTTALAAPSQGMTSWLNDSGTAWQYYELYNASTNPGGAAAAGWYPMPNSAVFMGTVSATLPTTTNVSLGAASYSYTENSDGLNWHVPATNPERITPSVAGWYRATLALVYAANVTGTRNAIILKNSVRVGGSYPTTSSAGEGNSQATVVVPMNGSTDYFVFQTSQSSGGNLALTAYSAVEFVKPASV